MKVAKVKNELKKIIELDLSIKGTDENENITPMLWGGPGSGKTAIVKQVADEMKLELIIMRLNTLSPLDVRGVPYADPEANVTKFIPPSFIPKDPDKRYLIFFDEINTAPPLSQSVAYEIAHERTIGGHPLPTYCAVVMAGNRAKDNGVTFDMPMPLATRCVHFEVVSDIDSFIDYNISKDNPIHEDILAFLKYAPQYLHLDDIKDYEIEEIPAAPCPRTWEMLSKYYSILKMDGSDKLNDSSHFFEIISGYVGKQVATNFIEFIRYKSHLPNLDAVLHEGVKFKSNEPQIQYFFVTALFMRLNKEFVPNAKEGTGDHEKNLNILSNYIKSVSNLTSEASIKALALHFLTNSNKSFWYNTLMQSQDMMELYSMFKQIMGKDE